MTVIEVFSGSKVLSETAEKIYDQETFTIDVREELEPDLCKDILYINIDDDVPERFQHPTYTHFSPPCDIYSNINSSVNNYSNQFRPNRIKTIRGEAFVQISLLMISRLQPKYWTIENPRAGLRTVMKLRKWLSRYGISPYKRDTVTYCQYGEDRRKPTDIWNNIYSWIPRPMCDKGDNCHQPAPRGSSNGTQGQKDSVARSRLPENLCEDILGAIFNPKEKQTKLEEVEA